MTIDEAVKALDENLGGEEGHMQADDILLKFVPNEIFDAYNRFLDRGSVWYA